MSEYDIYMVMDKTRDEIMKELYETHPIDALVSFSELDMHEKLSANSQMVVKYTELLNAERAHLDRVTALRDKIVGEQYDMYRWNFDKELKPAEIEKYYLPKDPKVIKANLLVRRQSWRTDFFSMCVKAINSQQWNLKNFLEALRT